MNVRQRKIVWAWIAIIVATIVYPPWYMVFRGSGSQPAGYHLLFAPPQDYIRIDQTRLFLEWIAISVVFAGIYFSATTPKSTK